MGKYSFTTTTIGDLLDNPEAFALFAELVPEAIDHPLLEIGRPFTIEQALPFVENIAAEMGIDNVPARIADFKEKLESL
ncbi:MAG: hypothetical protein IJ262_00115 [Clostridia bacterium]|nr:hypothetical protein [Clostridia bacterium]